MGETEELSIHLEGVEIAKRNGNTKNPKLRQALARYMQRPSSQSAESKLLVELNQATYLVPIDTSNMSGEQYESGRVILNDFNELDLITTLDGEGRTYIPACSDDAALAAFLGNDRGSVITFSAKDLWQFVLALGNDNNGVAINPLNTSSPEVLFLTHRLLDNFLHAPVTH